ncbi:prolyl oligopeptidase family serine peptidase [Saccharicrinis aurantiacus]|uniref:prolyl oligopeptidase family serine peptidase n=1 Tax=Saccharicrinis aurantiacus TaxID=1849719 RepID=UPI00248FC83F|nr:prolyl oligopeptidase family serine peptidase [Saccharicrinis aurantiacus]
MKLLTYCLITLSLCANINAQKTYQYPKAFKDSSVVNTYFGDEVADPYQWMENPNDLHINAWLEEQDKLAKKVQSQQTNARYLDRQIQSILFDGQTIEKNKKSKKDTTYQFTLETIQLNKSPNLRYKKGDMGTYKTLMRGKDYVSNKDDNILYRDMLVNKANTIVAITTSINGDDWVTVYFFDLKTGKRLADELHHLRSGSTLYWGKSGLYYDAFNKPKEGQEHLDLATGQKLFHHTMGTSQSSDPVLFINPDKNDQNNFSFSGISDRLFIKRYQYVNNKIFQSHAFANDSIENFSIKDFIIFPNKNNTLVSIEEVIGDTVLLKTNIEAPNWRIMKANINTLNDVKEIIPEYDVTLKNVNYLKSNRLACTYIKNAESFVMIFDLSGQLLKKMDFPVGKTVNFISNEDEENPKYAKYIVSSFYHPPLTFKISLEMLKTEAEETLFLPYNVNRIETRYVLYKSKDGTEIPMYITCLKNTKLNGKNPTLIYGYGGYGTTISPRYDAWKTAWIINGGILAVPNIRGGGALGSDWALQGRGVNKQNTIDDFIASAEYLSSEGYTNASKIAINGKSHGGLLVAAAFTQRPDLFKAVVAEAGPYDMLRCSKFTVGQASTNLIEFGNVTDSLEYKALSNYSPLHQIKEDTVYPNVLLITGDSDDRVPPLHSYKFLATLQEKGSPKSQYVMYRTHGAGHNGGLTYTDRNITQLLKYCFLYKQLNLRYY